MLPGNDGSESVHKHKESQRLFECTVWARILKDAFHVELNVWENDGVLHPALHLCSGK